MDILQKLKDIDGILVLGILIFFGLLELISGYLKNSNRTNDDWIQEVGSFIGLSALIKPSIVGFLIFVGYFFFPAYSSTLDGHQFLLLLMVFLLVDDVLQYWYHRTAHESAFLWKLHRPHHQAEEMGFFVSYRNAALYYLMMPNIWWVGLFTFLGGALPVAIGLVLKQLVIISPHSQIKWDAVFYKTPILRPIIFVLERIFITPAFHHAHHGKSKLDGVSDPNGNFGNMFSFWDQLFGTAHFRQDYPLEYGLPKNTSDQWAIEYLYPIIKSKNPNSELSNNFEKKDTKTLEAIEVNLKKGKKYLWCQCGKSKEPPFCDGSHHGTKYKPVLFEVKRDGIVKLCNCKATKSGPFCDNSHLDLL